MPHGTAFPMGGLASWWERSLCAPAAWVSISFRATPTHAVAPLMNGPQAVLLRNIFLRAYGLAWR